MDAAERKLDLRFGALIIATNFVNVYNSIRSSWYRLFTVPFFFRKIEHLPSVADGHLGVKCTKGKGVRVYSGGGGGGRPTPCQKEGQSTWYSSPGYNLGQKVLRILHFLTHRRPTLRIWHHVTPPPVPPPLPGQCCLVRSKNVSVTRQLCFFGGEGEVSWVNRALEGSILKLDLQGAFFLTFLSKIVGSLPAQDGRPQGQVLVSYHLSEK